MSAGKFLGSSSNETRNGKRPSPMYLSAPPMSGHSQSSSYGNPTVYYMMRTPSTPPFGNYPSFPHNTHHTPSVPKNKRPNTKQKLQYNNATSRYDIQDFNLDYFVDSQPKSTQAPSTTINNFLENVSVLQPLLHTPSKPPETNPASGSGHHQSKHSARINLQVDAPNNNIPRLVLVSPFPPESHHQRSNDDDEDICILKDCGLQPLFRNIPSVSKEFGSYLEELDKHNTQQIMSSGPAGMSLTVEDLTQVDKEIETTMAKDKEMSKTGLQTNAASSLREIRLQAYLTSLIVKVKLNRGKQLVKEGRNNSAEGPIMDLTTQNKMRELSKQQTDALTVFLRMFQETMQTSSKKVTKTRKPATKTK